MPQLDFFIFITTFINIWVSFVAVNVWVGGVLLPLWLRNRVLITNELIRVQSQLFMWCLLSFKSGCRRRGSHRILIRRNREFSMFRSKMTKAVF